MSPRRLLATLQIAGTVALLAAALSVAGADAVAARLGSLDARWLVLAVALTVPMQALSAWRWLVVARALGAPIGLRRALAEYYLAAFLNAVLPGGVVGDAARVWRHGGNAQRLVRPLGAVIVERGAGQAALALVLLLGLAHGAATGLGQGALLAPAAAALVLAAALLAAAALGTLAALGAATGSSRRALSRFREDLQVLLSDRGACVMAGVLSLAVVASYVATFLASARALGPLGEATAVTSLALLGVPLVLVAMLLPISVGGLGPREAVAASLWPALGQDASAGAAAALLYGAVILLGSLPGAIMLFPRYRRTAG